MARLICKGNEPHDYQARVDKYGQPLEFKDYKWEVCVRCGHKIRWRQDLKGRVDNNRYLKAHIRNFCQPWGATRKVFMRLYHPQTDLVKLCLYEECSKTGVCTHTRVDYDPSTKAIDLGRKGTNAKRFKRDVFA